MTELTGLFPGFHLGGGSQHRLNNALVAGATAHVPGKPHPHFLFGGIGVSLQKFTGAHEKSGSAKSTLQAVIFPETFLQGMKFPVFGQSLNGGNLRAIGLHRKN